jgi:hypothetical protein
MCKKKGWECVGNYCLKLGKYKKVLKFGNVWEVLLIAGKLTEVWECVGSIAYSW